MQKYIKMLVIMLCIVMFIFSSVMYIDMKTVKAADMDYDDGVEDEEDIIYDYNNINETYDAVSISKDKGHTYSYIMLNDGETNVYPIDIETKTEYVIGLTDSTYGHGSILIVDVNDNYIYEKEIDLINEKWSKEFSLSRGRYYIKIMSKEALQFGYELYINPLAAQKSVTIKKETKNIKMSSCDNKELNPKLGKGKWTTSNKNIVSILSKNTKNITSCKIKAKKTGKATVTYTNSDGSVIKYKIVVTANSTYPLDSAYFTMDYLGGIEPHILISNNSDKKIKYVYLTVSFYNAVGDKVKNEIGRYTNAKLQITGPIKPWDFEWYQWNPVFYNTTATKMKVENMTVIYMDGSKKYKKINKKYSIDE